MKKTIALIRVVLKENFFFFSIKQRMSTSVSDRILYITVTLLAAAVLGSIYYFMGGFIKEIFNMLNQVNQGHALLTPFILAGQLLVLIFGIFYTLSAFYFSKDLDRLVPLPLEPYKIVLSKYVMVLVNQYLTIGIFVLPMFFYYGILADAGPSYWLRMPVIFLLLPVIPLAVSSLVVIILIRIVNLSKRKEFFMILGVLLLMGISLLPQFLKDQPADPSMDESKIVGFLSDEDGLIQMISSKFPPAAWATKGLASGFSSEGAGDLVLFTGVSLLLFLALLVVGQKFFYHSLIGFHEVPAPLKITKKGTSLKKISSGFHPLKAVFLRELRIMNRTPVFLMSGMIGLIFFPAIILFMSLSGNKGGQFISKMLSAGDPMVTILVTAGFMLFCMTNSGAAASTISREGTCFWLSRVIPVPFKTQLKAKFLHSLGVSMVGLLGASAVLLIYLKVSMTLFLPALLLALTGTAAYVALGMLIDLSRPLLDWESPQKAIKHNKNVAITMFLEIGFIIGIVFLTRWLFSLGLNSLVIYFSLLAVFIIIAAALMAYLSAAAVWKYEDIFV
ncbi:MAG: hypothetical protein GY950_30735 [bacterium]|nr:hypothetical protein [bacterium]